VEIAFDSNMRALFVVLDETPSHWIVTLFGITLTLLGLTLLLLYCRIVNTNRMFCNPLSRTRNALRQVVTKPRYQNGPVSDFSNPVGCDVLLEIRGLIWKV
jgi:hypothetical protein